MREEDIKDKILTERQQAFERAEAQKRYRKKRKWLMTYCPFCQGKLEYEPKEGFTGKLKCPHCGKEFEVPNLDRFLH